MKPKQFFIAIVSILSVFAVISFVENKTAVNAGCFLKQDKLCCTQQPANEAAGSSYIFFEAVSKYLFISLSK